MTATLWIHRECRSDLLVRFSSAFDAYEFGCRLLKAYYQGDCGINSWDETSYTEKTIFYIGDSPSFQVSIHPGEFHTDGWNGLDKWAPDGTFIVSPEEAMTLGETGIPSEEIRGNPDSPTKESAFAEGTPRYRLTVSSDLVKAQYSDNDFSDSD